MNPDDKRLSMSLDEIIQMNDEKSSNSDDTVPVINGMGGEVQINGVDCVAASSPLEVQRTNKFGFNANKNFYGRRNNRNFNRYSSRSYENRRLNSSYPPGQEFRENGYGYWDQGYNRRYTPYRGRPNKRQRYYNNINHYNRRTTYRSQENLNNYGGNRGLTKENLIQFDRSWSNNHNNYNGAGYDRQQRSGSVFSNRSAHSNRSQRSVHSQRSYGSHRSGGSARSNWSFGTYKSFGSQRSFGSHRSFGSQRSYGSQRSFRSNRSNRSRRPWMNNGFLSVRRHRNILNMAIQEDIRKIQAESSLTNSIMRRSDLNLTFKPTSTQITLNERFNSI